MGYGGSATTAAAGSVKANGNSGGVTCQEFNADEQQCLARKKAIWRQYHTTTGRPIATSGDVTFHFFFVLF